MLGGLGDVAGAGLALGANHGRALVDAAQRLAEVGRAAYERHGKATLVDVVDVVGGAEHLGFVDVVHTQMLEDLRLHNVTDAGLGHHRDVDGVDDALDEIRVRHAGHTTLGADIGRHALQRHDGGRACILGDLGLLWRDHVHDHAADEFLVQLFYIRHTA